MDQGQIHQQQQMPFLQNGYSAPASKSPGSEPIIRTPIWMSVIRGAQFLFAIIILAFSGWIVHYLYMDCLGLCIAMVRSPPPSTFTFTSRAFRVKN
jgi:hypothetical protein